MDKKDMIIEELKEYNKELEVSLKEKDIKLLELQEKINELNEKIIEFENALKRTYNYSEEDKKPRKKGFFNFFSRKN